MTVMDIVEQNWIPDAVIRAGIRQRVRKRLRRIADDADNDRERYVEQFAEDLKQLPIAVNTDAANEQHYELPADFFSEVLGPNLKYSSAFYAPGVNDLATAEYAMLSMYAERAEIKPGQQILDLGCGWGSLTLYLAQLHPTCSITGVSNSHAQREFIESRARERGLNNVRVLTADINAFQTDARYDRILSIEMFEHMKNYQLLLRKISDWLKFQGKLFVHVFAHRRYPYHFDAGNSEEWLARHFFTGGLMPSADLLSRFQDDLDLESMWTVPGTHYEKTANAWLTNMDAARSRILPVFQKTYGADADRWWRRWRIFFMACAELFGHEEGSEWQVVHYRFIRNQRDA